MIPDSYFERFETPKYRSRNPTQRWLIRRFAAQVVAFFDACGAVESVLEIGIGEGFLSGFLSERAPQTRFVGIDLNPHDLERLQSKFPRIETHQGSAYEVPLDERFDLVICAEVLEHLESPERAVREIARLSAKHAIVTVPHEPWFMLSNFLRGKNLTRWGNDPEHVQRFRQASLSKLLARDLSVEELRTSYPWLLARCTRSH